MKIFTKNLRFRSVAVGCISLTALCLSASAISADMPKHLTQAELSPEVSRALKLALSDMSAPCALGGQHDEHTHNSKLRSALLSQDSAMSVDSARKLIFSDGELNAHQMQTLVSTLGELNAADSENLLRAIYDHAQSIAQRFVAEDIEDASMKKRVLNSNADDIRAAVVEAIGQSKSSRFEDLLQGAARGEGYLASNAKAVLKNTR